MRRHPSVSWFEPIVVTRPERVTVDAFSRIDSFVKIEGGERVDIGRYVHISSFCHVNIGGGTTIIEDGAAMASGSKIISGSNSPEGVSCSAAAPEEEQVVVRKMNFLGKNSILFANAVVLPGIMIGEGARVAAGSVVTKNVPPHEIWAGVPAKRIGFAK